MNTVVVVVVTGNSMPSQADVAELTARAMQVATPETDVVTARAAARYREWWENYGRPLPPIPDPVLRQRQLEAAAAVRQNQEIDRQRLLRRALPAAKPVVPVVYYTDGLLDGGEHPRPDWSGVVVPYPYDDDEQPATLLDVDATQRRRFA